MLVLFGVLLEVFSEVELSLAYLVVVILHLKDSGFLDSFRKGFELSFTRVSATLDMPLDFRYSTIMRLISSWSVTDILYERKYYDQR